MNIDIYIFDGYDAYIYELKSTSCCIAFLSLKDSSDINITAYNIYWQITYGIGKISICRYAHFLKITT